MLTPMGNSSWWGWWAKGQRVAILLTQKRFIVPLLLVSIACIPLSWLGVSVEYAIPASQIKKEQEHVYSYRLRWYGWPLRIAADATNTLGYSRLYEGDSALGPSHSSLVAIKEHGIGHYSLWRHRLYFSASDNTDPRSNGRTYLLVTRAYLPLPVTLLVVTLLLLAFLINTFHTPVDDRLDIKRRSHVMRASMLLFLGLINIGILVTVVFRPNAILDIAPELMSHQFGHAFEITKQADLPEIFRLMAEPFGLLHLERSVFEDGNKLRPINTSPQYIRDKGHGANRYVDGRLLFSSSDNLDPRTNGRTYRAETLGRVTPFAVFVISGSIIMLLLYGARRPVTDISLGQVVRTPLRIGLGRPIPNISLRQVVRTPFRIGFFVDKDACAERFTGDVDLVAKLAFASLFFSFMAAATAVLIAVARLGLSGDSGVALAGSVVVSVSILSSWTLALGRRRRRPAPPYSWIIVVILVVSALPVMGLFWGAYPLPLFAIIAVVGLWRATTLGRTVIKAQRWFLILGPPVLAVLYFLVVNGGSFAHVYSPEFALVGIAHRDTMFHVAIAEMIRNFGVVSTGLDGFVSFAYHIGSHVWMGSLSRLLDIPVFHAYYMGVQIFAVPMLLFSLVFAISWVWRPKQLPILVMAVALALLCLVETQGSFAYYVSESYLFAIIFYLLSLPLVIEVIRHPKESLWMDWRRLTVAIALALVLVALKISVGAAWCAGALYVFLRRYPKEGWPLFIVAVSTVMLLIIVFAFNVHSNPNWAETFRFDPIAANLLRPPLANMLLPLAVLIFGRLFYRHIGDEGKLILEFVALTTIVTNAPGMLLDILQATDYYFVNVATWLGYVVSVGAVFFLVQYVRDIGLTLKSQGGVRRIVTVDFQRLVVVLAVTVILVTTLTSDAKMQVISRSAKASSELLHRAEHVNARRAHPLRFSPKVEERKGFLNSKIAAELNHTPGAFFVSEIERLKGMAPGPLAVFVPPDNLEFWTLARANRGLKSILDEDYCWKQSFFVPALVGAPMIKGVPPAECEQTSFYGFYKYGDESNSSSVDDTALCAHAVDRGFNDIVVLESREHSLGARLLSCRTESGQLETQP